MNYKEKYLEWLNEPYFDEEFKTELKNLSEEEIEDRFFKNIEFGTGGIRGIMGAGTNRINRYLIARVTQGYADFVNEKYDRPSIAIAYDSRKNSQLYARTSAAVLSGNGIKVYLFSEISSTPELSFAVRQLKASGGIVITASHNPSEYNGYKVYQHDGYQILPDEANQIINKVNNVSFGDIKRNDNEGDWTLLGESFFETYYKKMEELVANLDEKKLRIVYTPLNGAGARPVVQVLKRTGFNQLFTIEEQMIHDSNFTTVPYPNPEEASVFEYAIKKGIEVNADILMATDPDSDRVGVFVLHHGKYEKLTGNQIGALLADYLLDESKNQVVITTIVSSHLVDQITKKYNAKVIKTLTGFKFIGEVMTQLESTQSKFVLGFEESYGYLTAGHARDKDAINTALMISQMANDYLESGLTLIDALEKLFLENGYFKEDLLSYTFKGSQGQEKMMEIISRFREIFKFDYDNQSSNIKIDYMIDETGLPKSNVLKFIYSDESWFAIRPSGTEPKLKIYLSVNSKEKSNLEDRLKAMKESIETFIGE